MKKVYSAYDGERGYLAAKGEETGMVWCPQRLSEIAVMRCAEYQKEFGCGSRLLTTGGPCLFRATPGQIRQAQAAQSERLKEPSHDAAGSYICPQCGGAKALKRSPLCRSCARKGYKIGPGRIKAAML